MSTLDPHELIANVKRQLEDVMDPELPFLTVQEMGMLRDVYFIDGHTVIEITPTYSGCPATDVITQSTLDAARVADPNAEVKVVMRPAWTTDWISEEARQKMEDHGIAPPVTKAMTELF